MKKRFIFGAFIVLILAVIIFGVTRGLAASNVIPVTRLGIVSVVINAYALKPPECAGLNLTTIVTGSGKINGTNGNDLILGSAGADIISGKNGNDCILGGGGDDSIDGSNGTDVCIGGPGTDTFVNCETTIQ